MNPTILIIEDESDLAAIIADYVSAAGYEASVLHDGNEALARVRRDPPDLVVLDLMLPGLDGVAICRAIRTFSDLPIIMLTARVAEIDRLLGLETGADDYVCKPFSPRELVARIKAILRRSRIDTSAQLVQVDAARRRVRVGSHALSLTRSEFDLFAAMASRPGTIFSRAQLLDVVSCSSLDSTDRAIDTHIKNLRRKIAEVLPDTAVIHSVYGLGYRVET